MKVYKSDAMVELTPAEVAALKGESEATPDMLKSDGPAPYRNFRDKVEHVASELHYETERTVLVCDDAEGDTIARYGYDGLEFDE